MALVSIQNGILWPGQLYSFPAGTGLAGTIDAVGEKVAHIGRLYIDGRPSSPKTLSAAGGKIGFLPGGSTVYANGASSVTLGIQGVSASGGPIAQPDGVFGAKATLVGGAWTFSGSQWNTNNIGSGSSSLSHGDLIAVVWDMTARGGTDRIDVIPFSTGAGLLTASNTLPTTNVMLAAAWQTTRANGAGLGPNILIIFDDGTLGWLDGTTPARSFSSTSISDSTVPDEVGMKFQVPWDCKIDALWAFNGRGGATADFVMKLYSAPLTAPNVLASFTHLGEQTGGPSATGLSLYPVIPEMSLSRNTDYAVTLRGTGAAGTSLQVANIPDAASRAAFTNGLTMAKVTRSDDTGNLIEESPAVNIHLMGVRISALDDGTGAGGGGGAPGSSNMLGGLQ